MHQLVQAALADYDERSLLGAVPPLADAAAAHKAVLDAVAGLGPLQRYLDDDEVEEIWINSPSQVFVDRIRTSSIYLPRPTRDHVETVVSLLREVDELRERGFATVVPPSAGARCIRFARDAVGRHLRREPPFAEYPDVIDELREARDTLAQHDEDMYERQIEARDTDQALAAAEAEHASVEPSLRRSDGEAETKPDDAPRT